MKSVRTNPTVQAVEGDERIRTAELALGTDPVYEYPTACPKRGTVAPFDAGWDAHEVGLERRTVEALSPDRGWALLGWDARALVVSRAEARDA